MNIAIITVCQHIFIYLAVKIAQILPTRKLYVEKRFPDHCVYYQSSALDITTLELGSNCHFVVLRTWTSISRRTLSKILKLLTGFLWA